MNQIAVRAPAKVNLGLRVFRKRADGYHEIETLMLMVSLYDDLEMEAGGRGIVVETDCPDLPSGKQNLVYRAADLLAQVAGIEPCVRIRLNKRIPLSAGLGGGSSDAAAALMGLNRLWDLDYSKTRLMELGGKIGMDVPFFLSSPFALAKGRGELLETLSVPAPPLSLLLVNPGFKVSTQWAYEGVKFGLTTENKHISIPKFSIPAFVKAGFVNDLERVTFKAYPILHEIKDALMARGAQAALMSGSGPTIFGLFPDAMTASQALKQLAGDDAWSLFRVHSLSAVPAEEKIR